MESKHYPKPHLSSIRFTESSGVVSSNGNGENISQEEFDPDPTIEMTDLNLSITEHLVDESRERENQDVIFSRASKSSTSMADDVQRDFSYVEFLVALWKTKGAPELLILCGFLSFGFGTLGIAPAITSDRYARINYGYDGPTCSLSGSDNEGSDLCTLGSDYAQSAAAYATIAQYSLSFITSPLIGELSDRHGRKGFMIAAVFLFNMGPLFLFLVERNPDMNPIWYFVANSSPGLLSWFGLSYAIMSDVVPPSLRAPALSLITIFAFSATSFVPLMAVIFGYSGAASICVIFCFLGFLYTISFLPETLQDENKREAVRKNNEDIANGRTILSLLLRPVKELAILNRNSFFRIIPFVVVLSGMVVAGDKIILLFYVQGQLGFTDREISTLVLLHAFVALCTQTFLLKRLVQKVGERYVVIFSMFFGVIYNFLYGVSTSTSVVMFGIALSAITGMAYPTASSMMSFNAGEEEQGKVQGVFYSLTALSNAFGPTAMQLVFNQTKDGAFLGPGSMFVMASFLYLIGTIFSYFLPPELSNSIEEDLLDTEEDTEERDMKFEEESEDTYFA